jgi:hypothetical protein
MGVPGCVSAGRSARLHAARDFSPARCDDLLAGRARYRLAVENAA